MKPAYNIPGTLYLHYGILVNVYYWNDPNQDHFNNKHWPEYKSVTTSYLECYVLVSFPCAPPVIMYKDFPELVISLSIVDMSHNYHYGMWQNSSGQ